MLHCNWKKSSAGKVMKVIFILWFSLKNGLDHTVLKRYWAAEILLNWDIYLLQPFRFNYWAFQVHHSLSSIGKCLWSNFWTPSKKALTFDNKKKRNVLFMNSMEKIAVSCVTNSWGCSNLMTWQLLWSNNLFSDSLGSP